MMKNILRLIAILLVVALIAAFWAYQHFIVQGGVPRDLDRYVVHIPTGANYDQVKDSLLTLGLIRHEGPFDLLAERMAYKRTPMRSGRFEVKPGWSALDLIRHLRGGKQLPSKVVLNGARETMNVAAKAARFLEPDSLALVHYLQRPEVLDTLGCTRETLMCLFIPNTYELYWNTTPEEFVQRMQREHDIFWQANNRLEKARQKNMTPCEVYTLASIVEKETNYNPEKQRMAGVYLNRLQMGMLLQADPTSVFATRDFLTKRVTHYHTQFDSPYNTYVYTGLPPGPIAQASISSIDAVLNAEQHDYLFFCAVGDGTGQHNFARNMTGHNKNIAIYTRNLRARGLR